MDVRAEFGHVTPGTVRVEILVLAVRGRNERRSGVARVVVVDLTGNVDILIRLAVAVQLPIMV